MKRTLLLLALSVFTGLGLIRITHIIEASSVASNLTSARAAQTAGSLVVNDVSATERDTGSAEVEFTVTLSATGFRDWDTLVDFATADGSGTVADGDYTSTSGTLTFPAGPGTVTMTVRVPVTGDTRGEGDETFSLNLSNARTLPVGFVNIQDGQGVCTILNDDNAPVLPQISINDVSIVEGNTGSVNASFTVTLSSPSSSSVMVSFATADETATVADNDYTNTFGTLTFPAGDNTPKTIVVPIIGDSRTEPDERFFVNLSNPIGATVADGQAFCTIDNDDQGGGGLPDVSIDSISVNEGDSGIVDAVFTVTLSAPSTSVVMVDYHTTDSTATVADNDYVATSGTLSFPPGTLTRTITVGVIGDTLADYVEFFWVNLSNPIGAVIAPPSGSCRIIDNEPKPTVSINNTSLPEGDIRTSEAKFRITISFATRLRLVLRYESRDDSAISPYDYEPVNGFLVLEPNTTSAEIIVSITGDFRVEPDERFFVDITESSFPIANAQGECTIFDDDAAKPGMSINDISMPEGTVGTSDAVFTVTLSAPSFVAVTVDYVVRDGTATQADTDYAGTSGIGTLTFPARVTTKQITVRVIGDPAPEPDETFVVDLYNARGANIVKRTGTCTLVDDDLVSRRSCSREPQRFQEGKAVSTVGVSDYLIISTVSLRLHVAMPTGAFVLVTLTSPNGSTIRAAAADDRGSTCVPLPDGIPFLNDGRFRGESSRGIWTLSVDTASTVPAASLDCWCLEIMGAETGIGITPLNADPFAYTTHQVKATVLAFGSPLSGADVNFDIVSHTNNAAHESALIKTDAEGRHRSSTREPSPPPTRLLLSTSTREGSSLRQSQRQRGKFLRGVLSRWRKVMVPGPPIPLICCTDFATKTSPKHHAAGITPSSTTSSRVRPRAS